MRHLLALGLAAAMLAGCAQPRQLTVDRAWVRLAAVPSNPAAAYFTIHGGPAAKTLINVAADVAVKTEMHESMSAGGMATMTPLKSVAIPADTDVVFAPGGRHVMLFDMNPRLKRDADVRLTLSFADGSRVVSDAVVVGAGSPAPR